MKLLKVKYTSRPPNFDGSNYVCLKANYENLCIDQTFQIKLKLLLK